MLNLTEKPKTPASTNDLPNSILSVEEVKLTNDLNLRNEIMPQSANPDYQKSEAALKLEIDALLDIPSLEAINPDSEIKS